MQRLQYAPVNVDAIRFKMHEEINGRDWIFAFAPRTALGGCTRLAFPDLALCYLATEATIFDLQDALTESRHCEFPPEELVPNLRLVEQRPARDFLADS